MSFLCPIIRNLVKRLRDADRKIESLALIDYIRAEKRELFLPDKVSITNGRPRSRVLSTGVLATH